MYEVFVKGVDYCSRVYSGYDSDEAHEEYYNSLSNATPSDEVILTLNGQIIEADCEHEQFELFDDIDDFDDDSLELLGL